jgi:hypothetical protein
MPHARICLLRVTERVFSDVSEVGRGLSNLDGAAILTTPAG